MLKKLSTALGEYEDHRELIKRLPEDSPMHAICRLYIIGGKLSKCSLNLMDRSEQNDLILSKKAQANARQAEEPNAGVQGDGEQEMAGKFYTADDYFID